jgi:hypothetical protein
MATGIYSWITAFSSELKVTAFGSALKVVNPMFVWGRRKSLNLLFSFISLFSTFWILKYYISLQLEQIHKL